MFTIRRRPLLYNNIIILSIYRCRRLWPLGCLYYIMYIIPLQRGLGIRLMFSATLPLVYHCVLYNIIMTKIFPSLRREQSCPWMSYARQYETENCVIRLTCYMFIIYISIHIYALTSLQDGSLSVLSVIYRKCIYLNILYFWIFKYIIKVNIVSCGDTIFWFSNENCPFYSKLLSGYFFLKICKYLNINLNEYLVFRLLKCFYKELK